MFHDVVVCFQLFCTKYFGLLTASFPGCTGNATASCCYTVFTLQIILGFSVNNGKLTSFTEQNENVIHTMFKFV